MKLSKLFPLAALMFALPAFAGEISCKVVGVSDGDTITCLQGGNRQIKVRMNQIDAPEKKQDFGTQSRKTLSDMVYGKAVTLKTSSTDRYGRTLAEVYVGGTNVNKAMVEKGMAWAYREYLTDNSYISLETSARNAKIGLWSMPNPIYPSDFRKAGKNSGGNSSSGSHSSSHQQATILPAKGGSCSNIKRTCKAMSSCAEAKQALACGVSSLDRDRDGIPCESLCR